MLTFSKLAELGTGRTSKLKGLWQPTSTILTLLIVAGALTVATPLWAGTVISIQGLIGSFIAKLAAVVSLAVFNFVYRVDITNAMLSAREVPDDYIQDRKNPIDIHRLVNHLCAELNIYFSNHQKFRESHQDLIKPKIFTFTNQKSEIITVEGYEPGQAALFFSTGMLDSEITHLNQEELAALIRVELIKIYLRKGLSGSVVGLGADLIATLKNMAAIKPEENRENNFFAATLMKGGGVFLSLFHFLFLLQMAVKRSAAYEASKRVIKLGKGIQLINANDKKVSPTLVKAPPRYEFNRKRREHLEKLREKLPLYEGWGKSLIQPIQRWIDVHEYMTTPPEHYHSRILRGIGNIFREGWLLLNELSGENPRNTNLNSYIRRETTYKENNRKDQKIAYETLETPEQLERLIEVQNTLNANLLRQIPEATRYAPLCPGAHKGFSPKLPKRASLQQVRTHQGRRSRSSSPSPSSSDSEDGKPTPRQTRSTSKLKSL